MSQTPKTANARQILIALHDDLGGWRAVEKRLGINRGYLSDIANGRRQPSNRVLAALGLPPLEVSVHPLSCGHAPLRKSCPVCNKRKYAPHPVMRLSKLRETMNSPYNNS